jgi:protein ImuA
MTPSPTLTDLRRRVRALERPSARPQDVLPFTIPLLDDHLPDHGLARGALHEVAGGGPDEIHAAAATLFAAGILARLAMPVLWCGTAQDIFAPGLACAGLAPGRVLHVAAPDEKTVLLVMEEALRHPALGGVVGELARLPMVASRRLALAAEKTGIMALALRRRREGAAAETGLTAAATRWRITPLPSAPMTSPGIGRARWKVELTRCRGGEAGSWVMEACDTQGCLGIPAGLADRQVRALAG